ncbi:hypothetical protein SAMN05660297_00009 [Natronincola peptidivorans]|uniref:Uncharacterized protein n=1 Tax=Natronincola peptidivorans TaxID=426128 RepID=A0A1H9Y3D4_9FIRM|nr:hypothetical protein [Natronincola peptidivorans]SES63341.1 hypothetical protein SAMN05660297_00009 [Natronincola peptidivorans]
MIKKIMLITLVLMLMTGQAFAALKVLPEEIAAELQGIAKETIAVEFSVDVDDVKVQEAWVQELFNLEIDLYHVNAMVGTDNKAIVIIKVDTKEILTQEQYTELMEEDRTIAPDEPVFRTMALDADETVSSEDETPQDTPAVDLKDTAREVQTISAESAPSNDEESSTNWFIPTLAILSIGGIGLILKFIKK